MTQTRREERQEANTYTTPEHDGFRLLFLVRGRYDVTRAEYAERLDRAIITFIL